MKNKVVKESGIEVIETIWYGDFGFVKGRDTTTNEIKIYAGQGFGCDEEVDIKHIVQYGKKYTPQQFKALIDEFFLRDK